MKLHVKSAWGAGVITAVPVVVSLVDAQFPGLFSRSPWMAVFALPSLPGYLLAFFLELGPSIEGIPDPTSITVYALTFAVWWGIVHLALAWRRRRRARARWPSSPLA